LSKAKKVILILVNALYLVFHLVLCIFLVPELFNDRLTSEEAIFTGIFVAITPIALLNALLITKDEIRASIRISLILFNGLLCLVCLAMAATMIYQKAILTVVSFIIFTIAYLTNRVVYSRKKSPA
jgi:hypothetical protein